MRNGTSGILFVTGNPSLLGNLNVLKLSACSFILCYFYLFRLVNSVHTRTTLQTTCIPDRFGMFLCLVSTPLQWYMVFLADEFGLIFIVRSIMIVLTVSFYSICKFEFFFV